MSTQLKDIPMDTHLRNIKQPIEIHYNDDGTIQTIDPYQEDPPAAPAEPAAPAAPAAPGVSIVSDIRERTLLGALLSEPAQIRQVKLTAEDFTAATHAQIFRAITRMENVEKQCREQGKRFEAGFAWQRK